MLANGGQGGQQPQPFPTLPSQGNNNNGGATLINPSGQNVNPNNPFGLPGKCILLQTPSNSKSVLSSPK